MKSWKHLLLVILVLFAILSLLLSACGPIERFQGNGNHGKDKYKDKVKDNGNEKNDEQGENTAMVTICHKTGSAKNPYVQITLSSNGAQNGHAKHAGDIIPAPKGGCPAK